MLLSASMTYPFRLLGLFHRGRDDLGVGAAPVGLLDEFAPLDRVALAPAPPLVILAGDLERRHQSAETEILNLFETLLDVLAGRFLAAGHLEGMADRLDMQRRPQNAAI